MRWKVVFHPYFEPEFAAMPQAAREGLAAAMGFIGEFGPHLGRPTADTLAGSRFANMKEIRFRAANGAWRVAFAFDPKRQAVVLCAGDKAGVAQRRFYGTLIATADQRFETWLKEN